MSPLREPDEKNHFEKSHNAENCERGPFGQRQVEGENLIVPKKLESGALPLCNGFVFHFRSFGFVQSQVLGTNGKNAQCTKVVHTR